MNMNLVKRTITTFANGVISKSDHPSTPQRLFAVVHLFGKQYIVKSGDLLIIDGHVPVEVGQPILLNKCLILGARDFSIIGRPLVDKELFKINATVIEHTMSDVKCRFFHKPRNHGIKKYLFQTLPRTTFRINEIELFQLPQENEMELISSKTSSNN